MGQLERDSMKDIVMLKVVFDKDYFAELLKEKKIKGYELARQCGLNMNSISQLKLGNNKNPNIITVYRLALALGCEMEDLMVEDYEN